MVRLACSSKGRRDSHRRSRAWRHSEVEDCLCLYLAHSTLSAQVAAIAGRGGAEMPPLSPAPEIPAEAPALRSGEFHLTIPNTSFTISRPASLRSDCCSPSSGMPFGFPPESTFTFTGIPRQLLH